MFNNNLIMYFRVKLKIKSVCFDTELSHETRFKLLKSNLESILKIYKKLPNEYSDKEISNSIISLSENLFICKSEKEEDSFLCFSYEAAYIRALKFYDECFLAQCSEKVGIEEWNFYFSNKNNGLTYLLQSVTQLVLESKGLSETTKEEAKKHFIAVYSIMYYAVSSINGNYELKNFIWIHISKILYMCLDKIND